MAVLQSFGKNGEIDKDKLIENLQDVDGVDPSTIPSDSDFDFPLTIVVDDYEVVIEENGDVHIEGEESGNTNTTPGGNTNTGSGNTNTGGGNTNTNPGGNTNTGGDNGTGGGNTSGEDNEAGENNGSGDTNTTNEIEIPDAGADGIIEVSELRWDNGTASITISKGAGVDSSLKMQYKKADQSDDQYVTVNGNSETISGLKDGDIVIVRLTDGKGNYGGIKTINIEDANNPIVIVNQGTVTETSIAVTVNATDSESGIPSPATYKYYIKKSTDSSYPDTPDETNNSNSYTFDGREDNTSYDIKVEVTDNAGNTGSGELKGIKTLITIPNINDDGVINVDGPNWKGDGTADITITKGDKVDDDLYIEYKKEGDDEYTRLEDGETIDDLQSGDKIYIHITDGDRNSEDKVIEIKDETNPTVTVTPGTATETSIPVTVNATDSESGIPSPATYKYYIKKSTDETYPTEPNATEPNSTYTFTELDDNTKYDIKVEVADRAENTGTGEATEIQTLITIPDANADGAIKVSDPQWNNGTASITITKGENVDESLYIEYKKEGDSDYTRLEGDTITGLTNGEKIYIHLTDGTRDGADKEITINDTVAPTAQINLSATSTDTNGSITATVTQTDAETGINITQTKYVYNTTATEIGTDDASYTGGIFSKTPQEIILNTTTAGTYYLHVLSVDNAGNKKETISGAVTVEEPKEPAGSEGLPGDVSGLTPVEGDEDTGIVAKDEAGNEWVWVEVPKSIFTTATSDTDYDAIYNDMKTYTADYSDNNYTDAYVSGSGNFASETEYNNEKNRMLKSVYNNGGFWISRYEIGTFDATEAVAENTTNVTPVSQQNAYPIINKTQPQSQQIARKINSRANLLFGVQWDLTLKFLQEKANLSVSELNSDSTSWGNYGNATFTADRGQYNTNFNLSSGWTNATSVIHYGDDMGNNIWRLTTGAADYTKKMNIYDLAGNIKEWTLEKDASNNVIYRGGSGNSNGIYFPAGSRNGYDTNNYDGVGLRASLYGNGTTQGGGSTEPQTGVIEFGNLQWDSSYTIASVTVSKTEDNTLDLQYKINEGEWTTIESGSTISNLHNGDIVIACLFDGTNRGYYTTLNVVGDITPPTAQISLSATSAEPEGTIIATVTQTDNESGIDIAKTKYVYNTTSDEIGTNEQNYIGGTFSKNPQDIILSTTTAGTYYLHVLSVDKAGNSKETISEAISVKAPIPGDIEGLTPVEGDENTGIVAKDEAGNEWIWVEVPKSIFTTATSDTDYDAIYNDIKTYTADYSNSNYTDAYVSGSGNFANETEYNNEKNRMLKSVYDNGGFWISRYEIGTTNASEATASYTTNVTTPVSKQNAYPIVNKTQPQLQQIVKKMNSNANLLFGVQWDLTLKFLQEKGGLSVSEINDDSTSWGNYWNTSFTIDRGQYQIYNYWSSTNWTNATNVSKPSLNGWKLTTGAADRNCKMNIYDIAGNVLEWTLESNSSNNVVYRGGLGYYEEDLPAGYRGDDEPTSGYDDDIGTRAALYGDGTTQGGGSTETQTGAIKFGDLQWDSNAGTASVTVTKTEDNTLDLQYKINEGDWTTINNGSTIPNLKSGDLVTACLYDGNNRAYYVTLNVQDITLPSATISLSTNSTDTKGSITATVTQTDNESGINIAQTKYVYNTTATELGTDNDSAYTGGTFSKNPQEIILNATVAGTYYLHVLSVDNAGNKKETISEAVKAGPGLPGDVNDLTYKEGDEDTGIVATDAAGNEWVWVEVPKSIFTTATSNTDYDAIYNDMKTYTADYSDNNYTDAYVSGSGNFANETEYNNEKNRMLKSIYNNGGFWISRYEIGTTNASEATASYTTNVTTPVSQQNAYPIVNKTQPQLQQIVKKMNSNANLLFGVQWDLTLKFLQEKGGLSVSEINDDSTSWGNYWNTSFTIDRGQYQIYNYWSSTNWTNATNVSKPSLNGWKLTTGAADRNCKMNIYDIAGNVLEWTLESNSSNNVVYRGGLGYYEEDLPAGYRGDDEPTSGYDDDIGTRAALYGDGTTQGGGSTEPQTGAIKFSNLQWDSSYTTASVTVTKTTSDTLELQYKINDGEWKTVDNGYTITGLKDGDLVTACLYDGSNRGYYATLNVQGDRIAPTATIQFNETTVEPDEEITATVTVTDNQSGVASAKYEFNTVNTEIGTDEASYTGTISGDTVTLSSSEAGTYYLHVLTIDRAGNKAETISEAVTIEKPETSAEEIAANPTQYYGQYVDYQPSNGDTEVKWKIFYAGTNPNVSNDTTNRIYLIADDYISSQYAPKGKEGTAINGSGYYTWFTNVIGDYNGASDIKNPVKSWLNYLNSYPNSSNSNIKAVAYMLDTSNKVWGQYKDAEGKAEYVIGGPTLDLFCASYNQKYPAETIEYQTYNSYGYRVKWSSDSSYSYSISGIPTDDLYIIASTSKADAMWFASPGAHFDYGVLGVISYGYGDYGDIFTSRYSAYGDADSGLGLRPVVCLKSDVKLKQKDGATFEIVD